MIPRHATEISVIDEGNREALAIEIGTSIPSVRVIRVLEELVALHGRPAAIRVDNGPELTAEAFAEWCREREIEIRPWPSNYSICARRYESSI
jgi:putative transposase